jgi:hypothetical protein
MPPFSPLLERKSVASDLQQQESFPGQFSQPSETPQKRYDGRMKSIPDPDTTPTEKMRAFSAGLRQILTVSKGELSEREKQYQAERATMPKRGPKSKSSASGHASGSKD